MHAIRVHPRSLRQCAQFQWRYCSSIAVPNQVRVRFAPSPTGQLHLGGLRTALYNYLYARSNKGRFILRIEDTDQTRLVPGATEQLQDMLNWSGIEIDEGPMCGGNYGPYIQSQRLEIYQNMIKKLLQTEHAYYCFCTPHRLDLLRKDALRRRETPKYDNRCRHLSKEQVQENLGQGSAHVVRLKLKEEVESWQDLIYGSITTDLAALEGDPILMKSDGFPTYHFANVVDDHLMEISHVLRGVEWQVSTRKHLLLYEAFGWQPPAFGHLPLLLNKDGKKLSKREQAIHVQHLKEQGYFPDAVLNFLTYSGSGFDLTQRDLAGCTMDDLIQHFNLTKLHSNSTRLEFERLGEFNRLHLHRYLSRALESTEHRKEAWETIRGHLKYRGLDYAPLTLPDEYFLRILTWLKDCERLETLLDLARPAFDFLWRSPVSRERCAALLASHPASSIVDFLQRIKDALESNSDGQSLLEEGIKQLLQQINSPSPGATVTTPTLVTTLEIPFKDRMKILRSLLHGGTSGPSVPEIMSVLGGVECISRLDQAIRMLHEITDLSQLEQHSSQTSPQTAVSHRDTR